MATVKMAYYQQRVKQGYDKGVKLRPLAGLEESGRDNKKPYLGKLGPNWEGPYRITSIASIGAYCLVDLDENVIPHPWNVNNLRRYYY